MKITVFTFILTAFLLACGDNQPYTESIDLKSLPGSCWAKPRLNQIVNECCDGHYPGERWPYLDDTGCQEYSCEPEYNLPEHSFCLDENNEWKPCERKLLKYVEVLVPKEGGECIQPSGIEGICNERYECCFQENCQLSL